MNDKQFKFSSSVIVIPFFTLVLLWLIYWLDYKFHINFGQYGIYPRTISGLRGVLFSPFIHGSLDHLYNNSLPLFFLLASLRFFYRNHFFKVIIVGILSSGILTWLIGRESFHIGASGFIYVAVSFIFFKGIYTKYYRLVALSLLIVLLYGSLVWYIFPNVQEGISWEGHLAGLVTGLVLAIKIDTPEFRKIPKYEWEFPNYNPDDDKFMQRFDKNGNFVNLPIGESEDENREESISVVYSYVEKNKKE